jgi:hypothetical protein
MKRTIASRFLMKIAKLGKPGVREGMTASLLTRQRMSTAHIGKIPWNKGLKSVVST